MSGSDRGRVGGKRVPELLKPLTTAQLIRVYKLANIKSKVPMERMSAVAPVEFYLGSEAYSEDRTAEVPVPFRSISSLVNNALTSGNGQGILARAERGSKHVSGKQGVDRKMVVGGMAALAAVAVLDRKLHTSKATVIEKVPEKRGLFDWRSRSEKDRKEREQRRRAYSRKVEAEAEEETPTTEAGNILATAGAVAASTFGAVKLVTSTTWTVGTFAAKAVWFTGTSVIAFGQFVGHGLEVSAPALQQAAEGGREAIEPLVAKAAPVVQKTVEQTTPLIRQSMESASSVVGPSLDPLAAHVQNVQATLSSASSSASSSLPQLKDSAAHAVEPLLSNIQASPVGELSAKARPVVEGGMAIAGPLLISSLRTLSSLLVSSALFLGHLISAAFTDGGLAGLGEELKGQVLSSLGEAGSTTVSAGVELGKELGKQAVERGGELADTLGDSPLVQSASQAAAQKASTAFSSLPPLPPLPSVPTSL
eukprot:CAMPEP_0181292798 /NCGR_PEP_ID=MMETSP1101-20121128/2713_1 /TAXON_ID=46948 /ORGANISM="Rhodomonas abbreviata, Strain Caron Lab Isolate" /LENGTH=479 /DNA_ID=CAMNT_0023397321 /DNA_START=245 /DNA_END=1680 /DNA_ORIENTATION=-